MGKLSRMVMMLVLVMLVTAACNLGQDNLVDGEQPIAQAGQEQQDASPTPTITDFPGDPLPTLTPRNTLRPPPTFEPPTLTPEPSLTPTITPTPTIQIEGNLPPLLGLYTDTPEPGEEAACVPREDWELFYEVQPGDALASIADKYNTYASELAEANCLQDPSLIVVGQMIRVPGELHPGPPPVDCSWELLTPFNGTITVPGEGTITFNWNGPEAPRYLVRVYQNTDGTGDYYKEFLTEFRTYYTMDLSELPEGGTYSWRVFPIGNDFRQIPCPESYHSIFTKAPEPTDIPNQQLPGAS